MIRSIATAIIVILAIVVGILNVAAFHTDAIRMASFTEFFSAALPILAFGALLKYLCCCKGCKSCASGCGKSCSCCKGMGCKCCGDKKECRPTV